MCSAEMLGKIVMTHYNKRTYRIDDLDYTKNPQSTFHLRKEDRDISYLEYYKKRYNIDVRQPTQPLLVSRPTRRDANRGDDQPIYLIPELCGMTGLTDDQKYECFIVLLIFYLLLIFLFIFIYIYIYIVLLVFHLMKMRFSF